MCVNLGNFVNFTRDYTQNQCFWLVCICVCVCVCVCKSQNFSKFHTQLHTKSLKLWGFLAHFKNFLRYQAILENQFWNYFFSHFFFSQKKINFLEKKIIFCLKKMSNFEVAQKWNKNWKFSNFFGNFLKFWVFLLLCVNRENFENFVCVCVLVCV